MDVSDARRRKALEADNARLKKFLAETPLAIEVTKEALRKNGDRAPAKREAVRWIATQGISERHCLGGASG